jgi:4-nitrophenyl phosphatase
LNLKSDILSNKRCFLLDMDGTFYLGDRLIDGALDFIELVERQDDQYYFLTNNSSKDRRQYKEKILRLGVEIPEDKVFTSGEATALYISQNYLEARVYLCGTPSLEGEFCHHGIDLVQDDPDLVVLGFDTTLTYEKLWRLCNFARLGLPYIATHPDINCPVDGGYMPDIGAMIAFIQTSTGRNPDLVVGKPNRVIIDMLARKTGLCHENLVMVGDRLYTDIALGKSAGIATILVLSGETKLEDLHSSPHQPDYVFESLKELTFWLAERQNHDNETLSP